jgi:hypothetical protein
MTDENDIPHSVRDLRLVYKVIAWVASSIVALVVAGWVVAGVIIPWSRTLSDNDLLHTFRLDAQKERLEAQDRRMDGQDKRMEGFERQFRFHERSHGAFPGIENRERLNR